jgi:diguanylate cyclase (GGDEF)-like protein
VMALIAIFILLVFILITYAITLRIVRPLSHLTDAAEHLADGDYEFDVEDDVDQEIAALNDALKKTSDKINSYMTYINNLAYRDALTGVKNSTAYNETVVDIERRMRVGDIRRFGVLVCDINMLKDTNDTYGHEVGNQLIIRATKIICNVFKHSPVFRVGGDEFVVLLEDGDLDNRLALLDVLDDALSKAYIEAKGDKIKISIARGLSVYNPDSDTKYEDIFTRADHNMYIHKDSIKSKK